MKHKTVLKMVFEVQNMLPFEGGYGKGMENTRSTKYWHRARNEELELLSFKPTKATWLSRVYQLI